ncbi:uncharacterized protein LOC122244503 [Penaeus japonicus]|uniref:uncharacterized protein LOC122244503 n=1 Tax=Penaeus japonicus TaxID=27405 RepID=UPI001C7177A9|nr:uncharacterized protein LOC122244503 [Penaeus japonicus]
MADGIPMIKFCHQICLYLADYGVDWKYIVFAVDVLLMPFEMYGGLILDTPLYVLREVLRRLCNDLEIGCHMMDLSVKAITEYILSHVKSCGCTGTAVAVRDFF